MKRIHNNWINFLWKLVFEQIQITENLKLDLYSQEKINQIQNCFFKLLKNSFEFQPQITSNHILNDLMNFQHTLRFNVQPKDLLPFIESNDIPILKEQAKTYSELYPDEVNKFQNVLNLLFN